MGLIQSCRSFYCFWSLSSFRSTRYNGLGQIIFVLSCMDADVGVACCRSGMLQSRAPGVYESHTIERNERKCSARRTYDTVSGVLRNVSK